MGAVRAGVLLGCCCCPNLGLTNRKAARLNLSSSQLQLPAPLCSPWASSEQRRSAPWQADQIGGLRVLRALLGRRQTNSSLGVAARGWPSFWPDRFLAVGLASYRPEVPVSPCSLSVASEDAPDPAGLAVIEPFGTTEPEVLELPPLSATWPAL
jgi:hypothetical protein